jgi:hypothetical protein
MRLALLHSELFNLFALLGDGHYSITALQHYSIQHCIISVISLGGVFSNGVLHRATFSVCSVWRMAHEAGCLLEFEQGADFSIVSADRVIERSTGRDIQNANNMYILRICLHRWWYTFDAVLYIWH